MKKKSLTAILSGIITVIVFTSCATTTNVTLDTTEVALPENQWPGDWLAPDRSYYGHESTNGLRINADGTGYMINSNIWEPRHKPSFWVEQENFTWTRQSPSKILITTTQRKDLAGGGEGFFRPKSIEITSTAYGLKIHSRDKMDVIYLKLEGSLPTDMASAIVEETRSRSLAMGGTTEHRQGPTFGQMAASSLKSYQQGLAIGH